MHFAIVYLGEFMKSTKSQNEISIYEAVKNFDNMSSHSFIRIATICGLYGISRATVWRAVKNGNIPKPVKLTERVTAWNVGVVRAALAAKAGV